MKVDNMVTIKFYKPCEKMPKNGQSIKVWCNSKLHDDIVDLCWLKIDPETGEWDGENELPYVEHEKRPKCYMLGSSGYHEFNEYTESLYWCYSHEFDKMTIQ